PPWRMNLIRVGMLQVDGLLAARVFVLPAFVAGAAIACTRSRQALTFVVLGIAAARLTWPSLIDAQSASSTDAVAMLAAQRVVIGTAVAVAGAVAALVANKQLGAAGRAIGIAS